MRVSGGWPKSEPFGLWGVWTCEACKTRVAGFSPFSQLLRWWCSGCSHTRSPRGRDHHHLWHGQDHGAMLLRLHLRLGAQREQKQNTNLGRLVERRKERSSFLDVLWSTAESYVCFSPPVGGEGVVLGPAFREIRFWQCPLGLFRWPGAPGFALDSMASW